MGGIPKVLLYGVLNLMPVLVNAQSTNVLWCHKIDEKSGLSNQDYNYYVYRDSEGFVWISSVNGLNRFDGYNVRQFHAANHDSTSLYGENIQSNFYEDSRKNLWFCTYEAINCYDRRQERFHRFFVSDNAGKPVREDYIVFQLERDSLLWFKAQNRIFRVPITHAFSHPEVFRTDPVIAHSNHYHHAAGAGPDGRVRYIFAYSEAKKNGLDYFVVPENGPATPQNIPARLSQLLQHTGVFQVYFENEENVWITVTTGLIRWNLKQGTYQKFDTPQADHISLARINDSAFLISAYNIGFFRFDKSTGRFHPITLHSLGDDRENAPSNIRNIYLDQHRVLWMTSQNHGVYYAQLDKNKFSGMIPENNALGQIRSIVPGPAQTIWVACEYGIRVYNPAGTLIRQLDNKNSPSMAEYINCIAGDQAQNIWLAEIQGLKMLEKGNNRFALIPHTQGIDFLSLHPLNNGNLIAGTLHHGVFIITQTKDGWEARNVLTPLAEEGYSYVYQGASGEIYISKNEVRIDVFELHADSLRHIGSLDIPGKISALYEPEQSSAIWIGSAFGLAKINKYRLSDPPAFYTVKNSLPNSAVQHILPGENGNLWISTYSGLATFDTKDTTWRSFHVSDGTLSEHFFPGAGLKLPDGRIWYGGDKGITEIPAAEPRRSQVPAGVLITEIKVDDVIPPDLQCALTGSRNVNQIQKLTYDYTRNTISFSFVAADYADPTQTRLKYKLENVDKDWVELEPGKTGFARYPNLASGQYRFLIQSANSDGFWSRSARMIAIQIIPPFYEEPWFLVLASLAALALVLAIARYRIRQIRTKAELKTRIAENKMSALVAQMNPHFIFNSLQSINSYILQNNRQQASEYLGRFSRLMRMILENSRNSSHPLQNEIEFLHSYLKVETQRFKTPFEYSISIADDIDPYHIQVPSMMLQPFVENAIWHGLSNKEGSGSIQINFEMPDGKLKCSVQDNGVGRKKASEMAVKKGKSHQSRALEIIYERLNLLFAKGTWSVTFTDLTDITGAPTGTRVVILLPVMD